MYKAVFIEDEHRIREALFLMLQKTVPDLVNVIGMAEGVTETVQVREALKPDMVFMDIQMKGGTRFEILEQLNFKSFHLIFTIAYEQHTLTAFKYNALDYLLKSIDALDLKIAIDRIATLQNRFMQKIQIVGLNEHLRKQFERVILLLRKLFMWSNLLILFDVKLLVLTLHFMLLMTEKLWF